jgi:hypothetical protein
VPGLACVPAMLGLALSLVNVVIACWVSAELVVRHALPPAQSGSNFTPGTAPSPAQAFRDIVLRQI